MNKTLIAIDRAAAEIRAYNEERDRKTKALEEDSLNDPYDQKLRAIMDKFKSQPCGHGMAGGAALFTDFVNPEWYKGKAAAHLLRVRTLRRWHVAFKGKAYTSNDLLIDAAFCRRRAAGLEAMPNIQIMGA